MTESEFQELGEMVGRFLAGQLALVGKTSYTSYEIAMILGLAALRMGDSDEVFFEEFKKSIAMAELRQNGNADAS